MSVAPHRSHAHFIHANTKPLYQFSPAALWTYFFLLFSLSCQKEDPLRIPLTLEGFFLGNQEVLLNGTDLESVPVNQAFDLLFTTAIDPATVEQGIMLTGPQGMVPLQFNFFNNNQTVRVRPAVRLKKGQAYELLIKSTLLSAHGTAYNGQSSFRFFTEVQPVTINNWSISGQLANAFTYLQAIPLEPEIRINFSDPVDPSVLERLIRIAGREALRYTFAYEADQHTVIIRFAAPLVHLSKYTFTLEAGDYGHSGQPGEELRQVFYTRVRDTAVFPEISDEALLTKIQEQTFRYFWDFGHPVSGLARERSSSNNLVTIGGSGFGLMAMIVAVERGFISREAALDRWVRIIDFLAKADRFHGVWPHWMDGTTGAVIPFSARDDGGDLVETAFMVQGLLTLRQYLDAGIAREKALIDQINQLSAEVEWSWYTKGGEKRLYWHWSPEQNFAMNLPVSGHNETQIVYILAAASQQYTIDKATYEQGYARNGAMQNGNTFYNLELPLGQNYGGPLFFAHYSYLGLDPRNLKDQYADYWQQNVNHSLINQRYCADNPKDYVGYSALCWGLTASDNHQGYVAHSPNNDLGVITPTAAISSLPYTPEASLAAIRHFYYQLGDQLWGEYGFYDAFNPTQSWTASSYLAIDQGPIICMIENYRSQLLWDLFMSAPEVQKGLRKLGFSF